MLAFMVVVLLALWVAAVFNIIALPILSGTAIHFLLLIIALLLLFNMVKKE